MILKYSLAGGVTQVVEHLPSKHKALSAAQGKTKMAMRMGSCWVYEQCFRFFHNDWEKERK
jgi:hypothetical protein